MKAEYVIHEDGRTFVVTLNDHDDVLAAEETPDTDTDLLAQRGSDAYMERLTAIDFDPEQPLADEAARWMADELEYGRALVIGAYFEVNV